MSTVSLFDARPFFEKALAYGVQHSIISHDRIEAMGQEAPKGMVQIARYFGSEFLRPELEQARTRLVNLVSLHLEHSSGGDLRLAAQALCEHSLLSRSKGGADLLKALIVMPQNSHFGMNEGGGFTDEHIPQLAKWSLRALADYRAELAQRSAVALVLDAATWLAQRLGVEAVDLQDAGKDAEAVIRTALLLAALKRTEMPDWARFENLIVDLRKKHSASQTSVGRPTASAKTLAIALPKNLPEAFVPVVAAVRASVLADLPKILDPGLTVRKLFDQTPSFIGRYFWIEDSLSEVDHFDRNVSAAWHKATAGHEDEGALLTLFLCVAAVASPKTLLTEKSAAALLRKIRKTGLQPALASDFIAEHAPQQHQHAYQALWASFLEEALPVLTSDHDYTLAEALALLRRECQVGAGN
jgi:hypothetical protein